LPENLVGSRLFGIRREKHGSAQLRKSTIMDCFLTNSKKRKVEITNNEKSKAYETEKRKHVFIPSWTTTYPWLQNGISGMTCTVCTKFDKTGTFITGCKNYKRDSINQHEKSEGMISPRLFLT
jgi:hypothetical protein